MDVAKSEREPLKLAAHNCELFVVTIEVAEKDFLWDSFIESLPNGSIAEAFAQHGFLKAFCNRRSKQIDYRAQVDVHKADEDSKSPKMHFHFILRPTTALKRTDEQPPFAEEIFQWMHQFISNDTSVSLWEQVDFAFSSAQYRSVFSLPSVLSGPLNSTENEIFEGARMVGVALSLQSNRVGVSSARQTVTKKSIMVHLSRRIDTSPQKLLSIENDVAVLRTVAFSTVRTRREKK